MHRHILETKPVDVRPNSYPARVVLAHVGGTQPYVTWVEVLPPNEESFFVWGHYFSSEAEARADFAKRRA